MAAKYPEDVENHPNEQSHQGTGHLSGFSTYQRLTPECEVVLEGSGDKLQTRYKECKKNEGHSNFIPVNNLTMEHIPVHLRSQEKMDLMRRKIDLTVKIRISYTSFKRPDYFSDSSIPYHFSEYRGSTKHVRYGTGGIHRLLYPENRPCPCPLCVSSNDPKKKYWMVLIRTATHVIYDDSEAERTTVFCFFDSDDSKEKNILYGLGIFGFGTSQNSILKSDTVEIMCVTHERRIVDRIRGVLPSEADLMPYVAHGFTHELPPEGVIVSHPHGLGKRISFGTIHHLTVPIKPLYETSCPISIPPATDCRLNPLQCDNKETVLSLVTFLNQMPNSNPQREKNDEKVVQNSPQTETKERLQENISDQKSPSEKEGACRNPTSQIQNVPKVPKILEEDENFKAFQEMINRSDNQVSGNEFKINASTILEYMRGSTNSSSKYEDTAKPLPSRDSDRPGSEVILPLVEGIMKNITHIMQIAGASFEEFNPTLSNQACSPNQEASVPTSNKTVQEIVNSYLKKQLEREDKKNIVKEDEIKMEKRDKAKMKKEDQDIGAASPNDRDNVCRNDDNDVDDAAAVNDRERDGVDNTNDDKHFDDENPVEVTDKEIVEDKDDIENDLYYKWIMKCCDFGPGLTLLESLGFKHLYKKVAKPVDDLRRLDHLRPGDSFNVPSEIKFILPEKSEYAMRYWKETRGWFRFPPGTQFVNAREEVMSLPEGAEFRNPTYFHQHSFISYDIATCPGSSGAAVYCDILGSPLMTYFPHSCGAGSLNMSAVHENIVFPGLNPVMRMVEPLINVTDQHKRNQIMVKGFAGIMMPQKEKQQAEFDLD